MRLKGKVHKYGANIDSDAIIPGCYLSLSEPEELAKHYMEAIGSDFASQVHPGDFIEFKREYPAACWGDVYLT